jgi:hypothetical protein
MSEAKSKRTVVTHSDLMRKGRLVLMFTSPVKDGQAEAPAHVFFVPVGYRGRPLRLLLEHPAMRKALEKVVPGGPFAVEASVEGDTPVLRLTRLPDTSGSVSPEAVEDDWRLDFETKAFLALNAASSALKRHLVYNGGVFIPGTRELAAIGLIQNLQKSMPIMAPDQAHAMLLMEQTILDAMCRPDGNNDSGTHDAEEG